MEVAVAPVETDEQCTGDPLVELDVCTIVPGREVGESVTSGRKPRSYHLCCDGAAVANSTCDNGDDRGRLLIDKAQVAADDCLAIVTLDGRGGPLGYPGGHFGRTGAMILGPCFVLLAPGVPLPGVSFDGTVVLTYHKLFKSVPQQALLCRDPSLRPSKLSTMPFSVPGSLHGNAPTDRAARGWRSSLWRTSLLLGR